MRKFNFRFTFLVSVLILSKSFGVCQKQPELQPYFVSIIVTDFDKSLNWYQEVFDLELLNKVENTERGFKQANLSKSDFLVELIYLEIATKPAGRVTGFFKFGLLVDDFEGWVKKLRELKVEFNGDVVDDPNSGKKMVIIKDPDGNRIQLFAR